MGLLLRLVLKALGFHLPVKSYLSEVSRTIESLPCPKNSRWFWGGLLHLGPVLGVIGIILYVRSADVTHSFKEKLALLLAASWVGVGPALIWYYERCILPQFAWDCRHIVASRNAFSTIRRATYSNVYELRFCRFLTPAWMLFVFLTFMIANPFISGFGIRGHSDILWWIVAVGVLLISYYTSLGFCLAHKAVYLTRLVARSKLQQKIYYPDGVFGLSFIGEFAFKTTAMFFSGWLFAPLIVMSANIHDITEYLVSTQNMLLLTYFVFTAIYFFRPLSIIHHKIVREKRSRPRRIYAEANQLATAEHPPEADSIHKRMDFLRKILDDIRAIPNWPLRLDTAVKFVVTSLFIPVFAGVLSAILKGK
jgi:hypothetical protein